MSPVPFGTLMVAIGRCLLVDDPRDAYAHRHVVLGELMVLLADDVDRLHRRRWVRVLTCDGVRWVDLQILAVA